MQNIIIDTNIWEFAYAETEEPKFKEICKTAKDFLNSIRNEPEINILINSYQICEIIEVFRKVGISLQMREKFFDAYKQGAFLRKELSVNDVESAIKESLSSSIHIYDYLVVYSWKDIVTTIYSADDHFMHQSFISIAKVINPLEGWVITEGKKPKKLNDG